jgi:hypothetical protein
VLERPTTPLAPPPLAVIPGQTCLRQRTHASEAGQPQVRIIAATGSARSHLDVDAVQWAVIFFPDCAPPHQGFHATWSTGEKACPKSKRARPYVCTLLLRVFWSAKERISLLICHAAPRSDQLTPCPKQTKSTVPISCGRAGGLIKRQGRVRFYCGINGDRLLVRSIYRLVFLSTATNFRHHLISNRVGFRRSNVLPPLSSSSFL